MRKISICLAVAATALGLATPAAAHWRSYDYTVLPLYQARVTELQARINRLAGQDILSRRQADRLRGAAAGLRALVGIKARDGLNTAERIELDIRISQLGREVDRQVRKADRWREGQEPEYHILNDSPQAPAPSDY